MSKETIKCTDENIKQIVKEQIELLGNEAGLNHLDVSNVTDMGSMFAGSQFNGDISRWEVAKVTNMERLFHETEFNGDISKWDVSNVTNMQSMFAESQFNRDIARWEVAKVTNMQGMFEKSKFKGDIGEWNVGNVINMSWMFFQSDYKGGILKWNITKVRYLDRVFDKDDKTNIELVKLRISGYSSSEFAQKIILDRQERNKRYDKKILGALLGVGIVGGTGYFIVVNFYSELMIFIGIFIVAKIMHLNS